MEAFKIKNGLSAKRYLGSNGTETGGSFYRNISNASGTATFDHSTQVASPYGIAIGNNDTKMYIVDNSTDKIYQYTLSTASDITTATYDAVSFSIVGGTTALGGCFIHPSGTHFYMVKGGSQLIYQYNLGTAFDISSTTGTVTYTVAEDTACRDVTFNPTGTKMYVMTTTGTDFVYQYDLSTAWDITTATYTVGKSLAVEEGTSSISYGISFNPDGTRFYASNSDDLYDYIVSTAYDISTASYSGQSYAIAGGASRTMFSLNSNGDTLFSVSNDGNELVNASSIPLEAGSQTLDLSTGTTFSFTLSTATTVSFTNPPASGNAIGFSVEINGDGSAITWPSSVKWHEATAPTATATKELYTFVTTDGGTTYYGKKAAEGIA
jgi:hypothetical protein